MYGKEYLEWKESGKETGSLETIDPWKEYIDQLSEDDDN